MEKKIKTAFEVLSEMHNDDLKNGSRLIAVSPNLISGDKVKGGAKISMGVEEYVLTDLLQDKSMALLLIIDKAEFKKRNTVDDGEEN